MTGSRGPLPKPVALRLIEGNPSKRPLDLSAGVNPAVEAPSAPRHITGAALKEWKRITPLLLELRLVSKLDMAALALYCSAYGRLVEYETSFNARVKALVDQGHALEWAVESVSVQITPKGFVQQSALWQLVRAQREEVNRCLGYFGLSPAHRARVAPSTGGQLGLPGIDEKPTGFAQFAR